MTPDVAARWRQVDALFQEALGLEPEARQALLDARGAGDAALRDEVAGLLAAAGAAADFLEGPPAWEGLLPDDAPPTAVGPYRVVRELGQGGMGVVYLAERADGQFEQRVALKTVQAWAAGAGGAARFRQERQVLARLEHPGITRLLDGGLDATGRPWLAMEYVEGEPLLDWADARALPLDERLRLFVAVARVVHFAHQHLVVHRDLKPSNILVTAAGEVKLLDFGIAKLLRPEDTLGGAAALATQTGAGLRTPAYASPEQVLGRPVTTAADVHALGVLLYELVAGRHPFRAPGWGVHAMERAVVDAEPERPSAAALRGDDADAAAEARGTTPARLRRRLAGDLDAVVLKALRKEPAQRYASAEAMAEDVERHRAGLPVRARRHAAAYVAARFARRHAAAVAAGALVLLSLAGGLGAALHQGRKAEREAAKASAVNAFLEDMLGASSPTNGQGRDATVAAALDAAAGRLGELAAEPDVEAAVRFALGRTYRDLGLYAEAEPHLRRALALRERTAGPGSREAAQATNALAILLRYSGRPDEAAALFRRAAALDRRHLGPDHPEVAAALLSLADAQTAQGRFEEADATAREAIAILRRADADGGPGDPAAIRLHLSTAINNRAGALYHRGDFAEAGRLFAESVALDARTHGERHPDVAIGLNNVGSVRRLQGHAAEAEALYRRALAIRRAGLGAEHPDVAFQLHNLAGAVLDQRRYDEAEALFREALAMRRRLLGPRHHDVGQTLDGLGAVLAGRGDAGAAVPLQREALTLARAGLGADHPTTARTAASLAHTLGAVGGGAEAERLYRTALGVLRTAQPRHPATAGALLGLGALLARTGRAGEAEPLLREAARLRAALLPAAHWQRAEAEGALGAALAAAGRPSEAEPLLRRAVAGLGAALGPEAPETVRVRERLAALAR